MGYTPAGAVPYANALADLHLLPILLYFSLTQDGAATLAKYPRLRAWLDNMSVRPSVQRTKGKYELAQ